MTRREEIRQEAHRKYPYVGGTKGLICENSIPIFIQGAEWADKTMIEKACKWLSNNKDNYIIDIEGETLIDEQIITDFHKAMEE
mgnify:CR=1 FL=1